MAPNTTLHKIGQLMPGLYTQICLVYSVPEDKQKAMIIATLNKGLDALTEAFPWLASNVVEADASGLLEMEHQSSRPALAVKDWADDASIPSLEQMRDARFPISMVDESMFCPRNTIPDGVKPVPTLLLQVTFIRGGLVLAVVASHATMDMVGQNQVMNLLSQACKGVPFSEKDLEAGNMKRDDLIPVLGEDYVPGDELVNQLSTGQAPTPASPPAPSSWVNVSFSASSLSTLKADATRQIKEGFVSTDDVLSAFIWQTVARVRATRLASSTNKRQFTRAVDVRPFFKIPSAYAGLAQNLLYYELPAQQLNELPLGMIASALRAPLNPATSSLHYDTRAIVTQLSRPSGKDRVSWMARIDLSVDVTLSSWARLNCYELDFGLDLGLPEAVLRPRFLPVESLVYLLPKSLAGDITVALCLRDDDIARLREDEILLKYADIVG